MGLKSVKKYKFLKMIFLVTKNLSCFLKYWKKLDNRERNLEVGIVPISLIFTKKKKEIIIKRGLNVSKKIGETIVTKVRVNKHTKKTN